MTITVLGPGRTELEARAGGTIRVTAVFERVGARDRLCHPRQTVLVRDVRDAETGELLADHLWFNRGKVWKKVGLVEGDVVCFRARPIEYRTGYWGPNKVRQVDEPARRDYKLTPPEGLQVIERQRVEHAEAA
jgi:hypothetical protein